MCLLASNAEKESQKGPLLRYTREEADDKVIFHLRHGVKVGKFTDTVGKSPVTDIFVCLIHNYKKLMYSDLEKLWFVTGLSTSRTFAIQLAHLHQGNQY